MAQKDELMKIYIRNGITNLNEIIEDYDTFSNGGSINIKTKNRGKFTEAAERVAMSIQEYARHILANKDDYSSTQIKRANFARNSAKWEHAMGGNLFVEGGPKGSNSNLPSDYEMQLAGFVKPKSGLGDNFDKYTEEQYKQYYEQQKAKENYNKQQGQKLIEESNKVKAKQTKQAMLESGRFVEMPDGTMKQSTGDKPLEQSNIDVDILTLGSGKVVKGLAKAGEKFAASKTGQYATQFLTNPYINTGLSSVGIANGFTNPSLSTGQRAWEISSSFLGLPLNANNTFLNLAKNIKKDANYLYHKAPILYPILQPFTFAKDRRTLKNAFENNISNVDYSDVASKFKSWINSPDYYNRLSANYRIKGSAQPYKDVQNLISDMNKNVDNATYVKLHRNITPIDPNNIGTIRRISPFKKHSMMHNMTIAKPNDELGYTIGTANDLPMIVTFSKTSVPLEDIVLHELSHASDNNMANLFSNNPDYLNFKAIPMNPTVLGSNARVLPEKVKTKERFDYFSDPTEIRARQNTTAIHMRENGLNPSILSDIMKWKRKTSKSKNDYLNEYQLFNYYDIDDLQHFRKY